MKFLHDFKLFINPPSSFNIDHYDVLDFKCLQECSFVDYICIKTINGEISFKPFVINYEELKDYIYDDCVIIAFNHLDKISMEVDLFV